MTLYNQAGDRCPAIPRGAHWDQFEKTFMGGSAHDGYIVGLQRYLTEDEINSRIVGRAILTHIEDNFPELLHEVENERGQLLSMTLWHRLATISEDWTVMDASPESGREKVYRRGRHFR